ncbi:MAG: PAS domain S-box protein [Candidatus Marinimicrobia bacterium]|nr:PAS domain S-box protein [Candidatus Neomarinimicrobiota bacterium]
MPNKKSKEKSQEIIDFLNFIPDATVAVNGEGVMVQVNSQVERMFGYKQDELIGHTVEMLIPERFWKSHVKHRENYFTEPQVRTMGKGLELFGRHKDGREFPIDISLSPMQTKGELLSLASIRDITEHKRVEEELKSAQEYFSNLIDSCLDMIISVDKKRRIVEFNRAAEKTFSYSKAEVMCKHINILYADPTEGLKAHKTTKKTGRFSGEIIYKRKNGETFICFLSSSILLDKNGEFIGVMGVSRDITERFKIRKELEKAMEQAEEGNRIKTLFLANMSHEIRTPLNTILGFTDLIEQSVSHLIGQGEKTFFETIQQSGKRLMGTVHKILDISQIEGGTYDLSTKILDLKKLTDSVVKEFKPMAERKGLELSYLSNIEDAVIRVDEYCITSALSNLIDNALKYTEEGKIDVTLEGRGNKLSLTIKDTGVGISEEYIEHLFDVFSQESMGYTKKYQGVGLGLALTKRYLDMNNVVLNVQSTKGLGTTFVLTFTLAKRGRPKVEVELKEELIVKPLEKPLVLLVEDDIASQKLTSFFLKRQYDICFAVSVAEAKERLKKQTVDLILLDLSLFGDEDGLDLVRHLRKTKKWRGTPIIAVTAHAFTTDRDNCLAAGCNDYMAKPIKQDELLAKLKQYIPLSN